MEGGSVQIIYVSRCGSRRPKNITDPTDPDPEHGLIDLRACRKVVVGSIRVRNGRDLR